MSFSTLKGRLTQRPKWLHVVTKHLIKVTYLDASALSDLVVLCQQKTNDEFSDID